MPTANTAESKLAQLRVFWGALAPVPLLFLGASMITKTPKGAQHVPLPALAGIAAVLFVVSVVMPPRVARERFTRFPIPPDATREQKVLAAYNAAATSLPSGSGPAVAIAVLGFAAMVFESAGWLAAPFFLASYVALALQFPTHEKVLALLEPKRGANAPR